MPLTSSTMDFELKFLSLTVFLSSFIFLMFLLLKATATSRTNTQRPPPGPRKFPFIGNLHLLASSRPPHRILRDLALKHGPLMQLQLGEVTTVVVTSPETAKEVMTTHDINFAYRPSLLLFEILTQNKNIAFAPYGEYWRELRKICTLELLSMKRVQSFRPVREEEFSNLCRWIASNAGLPVNLSGRVSLTTSNVIARASFGKMNEERDAYISVIKEGVKFAAGFHIGDLYPSIELFRLISGMRGKLERLHKKTDRILQKVIDEHKVANGENKGNEIEGRHEDLVDVLLKFHDDGCELPLTNDNIKAVLSDIFSAGTETSATTIDWAMAEMLRHPKILRKAQDEVRLVFDDKGYVDETYFHELKYLKSVIKETLRMHPPVPLLLPRESHERCEINGYEIPAKARVLVNVWAIGRDPRYWKEPDSFEPDRYLDSSVDYKVNNFEYLPFGAGRRICPGISFGLANVELPLAMFLYHFDWSLPNGNKPEDMDMTESIGINVRRKQPLYIIPTVKKTLPS